MGSVRLRIYRLFDRANSSLAAKLLAAFSVTVILLSFLVMVLQSIDQICPKHVAALVSNITNFTLFNGTVHLENAVQPVLKNGGREMLNSGHQLLSETRSDLWQLI
jgi:hypothetical protein